MSTLRPPGLAIFTTTGTTKPPEKGAPSVIAPRKVPGAMPVGLTVTVVVTGLVDRVLEGEDVELRKLPPLLVKAPLVSAPDVVLVELMVTVWELEAVAPDGKLKVSSDPEPESADWPLTLISAVTGIG